MSIQVFTITLRTERHLTSAYCNMSHTHTYTERERGVVEKIIKFESYKKLIFQGAIEYVKIVLYPEGHQVQCPHADISKSAYIMCVYVG